MTLLITTRPRGLGKTLVSFVVALFAAILATGLEAEELTPTSAPSSESVHPERFDPAMMMGTESCDECHGSIVSAWESSQHSLSLATLHEKSLAEEIADLLGIQPIEIRQQESCIRCHYTQETIQSVVQLTEAVSCESCHGASADWIDLHNSKGLSEQDRSQKSIAKGMLHPNDMHEIGKRCYDCHIVDDEKLVNAAGHPALSKGFELYSWSQGEVKHNFLISKAGSSIRKNGNSQQPIAQSRKRQLYLSGKLMELSATLSALGKATNPPVDVEGNYIRLENGHYTYGVQLAQHAHQLTEQLRNLQTVVPNDQFAQALTIMEGVKFETGNQDQFVKASRQIDLIADEFCEEHDGSTFAALDPMLANLKMR